MAFRITGCLTLVALASAWMLVPTVQAAPFADVIHLFSPGGADLASGVIDTTDCHGGIQPLNLSNCLGSPDGRYVSIGEQGSITIAFSGSAVIDGIGDDFIVWGSCNAANEPAEVSISQDGIAFISLGTFLSGTARYFDLAGVGLVSAQYVRVTDLAGGIGLPIGLAFDLDAVEAINSAGPVLTVGRTFGQLKAMYR